MLKSTLLVKLIYGSVKNQDLGEVGGKIFFPQTPSKKVGLFYLLQLMTPGSPIFFRVREISENYKSFHSKDYGELLKFPLITLK
ncbi:MAG: hypothetical protein HC903_22435 [Methylacidiphilales bacterium]|nr:hypothetical protein [Candidatus Methylacidiphilales bacterium]